MRESLEEIYAKRFDKKDTQRSILWQALARYYFQQYIDRGDTVLDLAAGYCEFINSIKCGRKIAVDYNTDTKQRVAKDVEFYHCKSTELPKKLNDSVDKVFVSNFFEHLSSGEELIETLKNVKRVLKKGGKILILQPNIKLTKGAYWDFIDHKLPLTEKSLVEAIELAGLKVDLMKVRFLPYTTESRLPINETLIKVYLRMPFVQYLFGKQTFVIAVK